MFKNEEEFASKLRDLEIDGKPSEEFRAKLHERMFETYANARKKGADPNSHAALEAKIEALNVNDTPSEEFRGSLRQGMLDTYQDVQNDPISPENLGAKIKGLRLDDRQSYAFHDELYDRAVETYAKGREKRKALFQWKNKARKFALATSILIVMGAAVWTLMSVPGALASVSLGAVLKEIRKVRPVTYNANVREGDSAPYKMHWMVSASGRARWITPDGAITIVDPVQGEIIMLTPANKTFRTITYQTDKQRHDPLEQIRKLQETDGGFAGTEQLDGQLTNVFQIKQQDRTITIWADAQTNLPIRVEIITTAKTATAPSQRTSMILSDFVWGADLPEELFALTPPEGYVPEWQRGEVPTEADLIEELRLLAKIFEGVFPPSLNPSDVRRLWFSFMLKKGLVVRTKIGDSVVNKYRDDDPNGLVQTTKGIVKRGIKFVDRQEGTATDWHYFGGGVKLGDANAPICWWRPKGSTMYRVVYGDLSIRNLAPDQLPKRPKVPETQSSTSEE